MTAITEMGGIIFPPVPAFYQKPETIDDVIDQSVGRALDLFGFEVGLVKRWGEESDEGEKTTRVFRRPGQAQG